MTPSSLRQATKRLVLARALTAAATTTTLSASPALAAEGAYQPLVPITTPANTNYVRSSTFQQPGSIQTLNPQPLPPKSFPIRSLFGR